MCQRVTCPTCNRPTFAGCGQHVEQVLGDVSATDRCQCATAPRTAPARSGRSWFGSRRGN